jgi:prepilin-type N-terminal cleavage/methylation domain-containing protein
MRIRRGLTLIEVLLAIVLLAVLAATLAPYLGARQSPPGIVEYSAFTAEVRNVLAGIERTRSEHPTIEEIRPALLAIRAPCRVASDADPVLGGQWVSITRGTESMLYWVRLPESEASE